MFEDLKISPKEILDSIREQAKGAIVAELAEVATYHRVQELVAKVAGEMATTRAEIGSSRPSAEQRKRLAKLEQLLDALTEVPAPHLTYLPALWLATGAPAPHGFRILGAEDTL